jgi:hypothetical protein
VRRDHHGASPFATEQHCTTLSARDSTLSCVVNPGAPSAQNRSPFHHSATPSEKQTNVPRSLEMSGLHEMMYRVLKRTHELRFAPHLPSVKQWEQPKLLSKRTCALRPAPHRPPTQSGCDVGCAKRARSSWRNQKQLQVCCACCSHIQATTKSHRTPWFYCTESVQRQKEIVGTN